MKVKLVAPQKPQIEAWKRSFDGEDVEIIKGYFEAVEEYDAISAAGNSQGVMGAGWDGALRRRFPRSQAHVFDAVRRFGGEIPVGSAVGVATEDEEHPWLIYAPTMPRPGTDLTARDDTNGGAYLQRVTYAALRAASFLDEADQEGLVPIHSIVLPAYGTGIGGLGPRECAGGMALGYIRYLRERAHG